MQKQILKGQLKKIKMIDLNNPNNLNPDIEAIKGEINKGDFPKLPVPSKPLPKEIPKNEYFPSAYDINTYNKVKEFFQDGTPKYSNEKKEEMIENWNDNPKVKNNGIEAIDTKKKKPIKKGNYFVLIILAFLGILALLVVAGAIGYSTYKTGNWILPADCGNTTVSCGDNSCPTCTSCPDLGCPETICGDCNFPDYLEVSLLNETN